MSIATRCALREVKFAEFCIKFKELRGSVEVTYDRDYHEEVEGVVLRWEKLGWRVWLKGPLEWLLLTWARRGVYKTLCAKLPGSVMFVEVHS